ncbi:alpha/beta-hydrolase, partial [Rhizoclosmatium globosum]
MVLTATSAISLPRSQRKLNLHKALSANSRFCVLLVQGFLSTFTDSKKASYLREKCKILGCDFITYDHSGHGPKPSIPFNECTLTTWKEDLLELVDGLGEKPIVMVGSSMGLHLTLHAAKKYPTKIKGIIGVGGAFRMDRVAKAFREYAGNETVWNRPSPYSPTGFYEIHLKLVESLEMVENQHRRIGFDGPVVLVHGMKDDVVPTEDAFQASEAISSSDVEVRLLKDGDHRLSSDESLAAVGRALRDVLDQLS